VDTFLPRLSRHEVELPIRFFSADGLATGLLLNVSESGFLADFDRHLAVWTTGELTATVAEGRINIKARVSRTRGNKAGLTYLDSLNDCVAIRRLVDFAIEQGKSTKIRHDPVRSSP
jgi:hypothetical protein